MMLLVHVLDVSGHQEQVPRKQGLKLLNAILLAFVFGSSRASSTKTRIETFVEQSHNEQGQRIKSKFHENKDWNLKLMCETFRSLPHQEQVPRKQGLKPARFRNIGRHAWTSRASSTKTRIETGLWNYTARTLLFIKSKFHENKDWNYMRKLRHHHRLPIKSKFHENKDWN